MAKRRAPPVIPEIAKAYQNDPRTQLALAAMKTGTSTDPVAQGKYAYADGAARALQAVIGAYVDKQQSAQYGADQDKLLAERKARGVDGLNAMGLPQQPVTPQMPPVAPPSAPEGPVAAAAALGAPPPVPMQPPGPAAPGMPPAIPTAPIPTSTGGVAPRRVPFGQPGAPEPQYVTDEPRRGAPMPEPVPEAPEPLKRPTAPEAVKATRSKLLEAAYKIMVGANPYESASGQDLYGEGLSDQTKLDEAAAEREQRLRDMGYQTDLSMFADAASQDRGNAYAERRDVQGRNFQALESFKSRQFQHDEGETQRRWQSVENARDRAAARINASISAAGSGPRAKPLPGNIMEKLVSGAGALDSIERIEQGFDPKFTGRWAAGPLQIAAAKVLPGNEALSDWWQDYQAYVTDIRRDKYGATLTNNEKASFNQIIVTPSMDPKKAAANLAKQRAIVATALARRARVTATYYGAEGVAEAIGRDPAAMSSAPPAVAPPSGGLSAAEQTRLQELRQKYGKPK